MDKVYMCIDLKSFYASVECIDRGLDPLTTHLVVADMSRTEKTICLAASPAIKQYGVPSRARLFEVIQKAKEINRERLKKARIRNFIGESIFTYELDNNPKLAFNFIAAKPRMARYIEVSSKIYDIYLKYVAKEDIHVYSIDEVFMDITSYLNERKQTPIEFAKMIIKDVLKSTGITSTAGVGTNMYLAKVAMDIVAKKIPIDEDGFKVAYLNEQLYKETLWEHLPITDFWRVGRGYENRLARLHIYTMGDIARCSLGSKDDYFNEDLLYKEFGINAELLIDHAWGYEPTTMNMVKSYRPSSNSMSTGQVLHCAYTYTDAMLVVSEMTDLLSLDLVNKGVLTNQIVLSIGYDIDSLKDDVVYAMYDGEIVKDIHGRRIPKSAHATINLEYTSSFNKLNEAIIDCYKKIVNDILLVRRINISANHIIKEEDYKKEGYQKFDLFTDIDKVINDELEEKKYLEKEKKTQKAILAIKNKYGKNSVIKGMNLEDNATTVKRNTQIGGHEA